MYICVCMYICIYALHVYVYMHMYTYVPAHMCIWIAHVHIHAYTCTYAYPSRGVSHGRLPRRTPLLHFRNMSNFVKGGQLIFISNHYS